MSGTEPASAATAATAASVGEVVGHAVAARLRVVPQVTARASSGAFALFVGAVLTVGLLGLLALNTLLTQDSFTATDLGHKQDALADQEQALQREVAVLGSPSSLAAAARQIGMVGTVNPAFIDPRTGRVLGVPLPGRAVVRATPAATAGPTTGATPAPTSAPTSQPAPGATPQPSGAAPKPPASPKPTSQAPKPTGQPKPGASPTTGTR
jgi:hypothetical protein